MDRVVDCLETDLQFMLKELGNATQEDRVQVKEQLKKVLPVNLTRPQLTQRCHQVLNMSSEQDFLQMLDQLSYSKPGSLTSDLSHFKEGHKCSSQSARAQLSARRIRQHFDGYRQVVPKSRIDMWKMLSRALIQYERILTGTASI